MVCCCTRRVAVPDARFRMPGLRFGITLGTRRLAGLVGSDAARQWLESSAIFDAKEALSRKFLTEIRDEAAWPDVVDRAREAAVALPATSQSVLLQQTSTDHRQEDLAALVRSLAEPGEKLVVVELERYLPEIAHLQELAHEAREWCREIDRDPRERPDR